MKDVRDTARLYLLLCGLVVVVRVFNIKTSNWPVAGGLSSVQMRSR